MQRIGFFILFLFVVIAVDVLVHWYLWIRLVRDPQFSYVTHRVLTVALIVLALSLPLTFALSRMLPLRVAGVVLFPAYLWMGMMLLFLLYCLSGDAIKLVLWSVERLGKTQALLGQGASRLLVNKIFALGGFGLVVMLTIISVFFAMGQPRIVHKEIPIKNLNTQLDGLKIVHLSDLHIGPLLRRAWVERVVALTNAQQPDLIVITGDLVDGSPALLADSVAPLAQLDSRLGVYFVTGNHEFYSGWDSWREPLAQLGIRALENRLVSIEDAGAVLELAGINDFDALRVAPRYAPDLVRALSNHQSKQPLILLSHQVRIVEKARQAGVSLLLSGHNHGGQIWPWGYMVYLQQPILAGLHHVGQCWVYVSEGTGFWGPPMRLGTHAEIAVITLRTDNKSVH